MKFLQQKIKKALPYHHYRHVFILCLFMFVALSALTFGLSRIIIEPIPYDSSELYEYMYVEVDKVYDASSHLYLANDNQYVYVYYDEGATQDIISLKTISGVPTALSDQEYESLLPTFQEKFPLLKVKTIDEMKEYIGLYALDSTLPHLQIPIIISFLLCLIPIIISIIYTGMFLYLRNNISSSLKRMVDRQEDKDIIRQLSNPIYKFKHIKALFLKTYLVMNHPMPYAIQYEDIQWVYLEKKRFLFLFDKEINIIIHDCSFKKTKVLYVSGFFKKNEEDCDDLLEKLVEMNPAILIGYNTRNRQEYYLRKREYKNSGVN